jgi:hypothetical protein
MVAFAAPKMGDIDTEPFCEWLQAFAMSAGVTRHV